MNILQTKQPLHFSQKVNLNASITEKGLHSLFALLKSNRNEKKKKHSPNFENVSWDTEKLESTLQSWSTGTPMNWSAIGRAHGIQGGNAGQVVREFAEARNIDVEPISSCTPKRKKTNRLCKKKLVGCDVSIPSNPPIRAIEAEIKSMISSGRFMLGEECTPYKVTKYKPDNGTMTPYDIFIHARKVPLKLLRQRLLSKQIKYMRLTPLSDINAMTRVQVTEKLPALNCDSMSHEELCQQLFNYERSRSLCMWHDHATILKMGFIMITTHVMYMYDPIVFYTDREFQQLNPGTTVTSIQSEVEQPEIHILGVGSSSVEDQAALTGDRISCLLDLSTPVQTENGTEITDTLRFFTGDYPATQFEQGNKQGGTYKCGVCGCKEHLFDDQAHSLFHQWRSLEELQSLATSGQFGRRVGILRPFDLKVAELRTELRARGVSNTKKMHRENLQKSLDQILRGVVRVPALLLTDPIASLASLNLGMYEVVASEPLHDIKGHIINLITELPYILPPGETATKCSMLPGKGEKIRCRFKANNYSTISPTERSQLLSKSPPPSPNSIKIGEISYSLDDQRSPRQLLQMYNVCWIHMELCRDLISAPKKITRSKMHGHYLHALTAHSPTQYELSCLRSLTQRTRNDYLDRLEELPNYARIIILKMSSRKL